MDAPVQHPTHAATEAQYYYERHTRRSRWFITLFYGIQFRSNFSVIKMTASQPLPPPSHDGRRTATPHQSLTPPPDPRHGCRGSDGTTGGTRRITERPGRKLQQLTGDKNSPPGTRRFVTIRAHCMAPHAGVRPRVSTHTHHSTYLLW